MVDKAVVDTYPPWLVAAISLAEARRLEAARLEQHVRKVVNGQDLPAKALPGVRHDDPARLRGLPAIGRNVSGHIHGTEPGFGLFDDE
jgi:hypothetical protein